VNDTNTFLLSELAHKVDGTLLGNPNERISGLCSLDEPKEGCISFTREISSEKIRQIAANSTLAAILVNSSVNFSKGELLANVVLVKDPLFALVQIVPLFYTQQKPTGISEKADIHPSAKIGQNVRIGAFAVIGENCRVSDDVVIHPHAVLYSNVSVGARSLIHAGAVIRENCTVGSDAIIQNGAIIGSDGFGYTQGPRGLIAVPQIGSVTLADSTEVGANTCIDRATLGTTSVGENTKIDNLSQVGHNTKIGSHSIICGQAGIAGSCKIGSGVIMGGGAGVADHVTITDKVRLAGRTGVTSDILKSGDMAGFPAMPAREWRKTMVAIRRLPEIIKQINLKNKGTK